MSEATKIMGALAGTTMRNKVLSVPAPDIRAASSRLASMFRKAAAIIMTLVEMLKEVR